MLCAWKMLQHKPCGPETVAMLGWDEGWLFPCCAVHVAALCDLSDLLSDVFNGGNHDYVTRLDFIHKGA